jgi:homopolymeric O-antigen transport system ATP-binding protein
MRDLAIHCAIHCDRLSKRYTIGAARASYETLRDRLTEGATQWATRMRGRGAREAADARELWALRDVSFEVAPGEVFAVIGRNGAGKSTLLKILSRVTAPTSGRVALRGQIASLLEVGTGFHHELTGRENIYLNGAILGIRKRDIDRDLDAIVAFAEIDRMLDTPVKRYSSGMQVRLAFAVAAHLRSDILVVDEVLAVGDLAFQRKVLGKVGEMVRDGRTVLFVSHNMGPVLGLCTRGLLLDRGRVVTTGPIEGVVRTYLDSLSAAGAADKESIDPPLEHKGVAITSASIRASDGQGNGRDTSVVDFRYPFTIAIAFDITTSDPDMSLWIRIANDSSINVLFSWILFQKEVTPGSYVAHAEIPGQLLIPGQYFLDAGAEHYRRDTLHYALGCASFEIANTTTEFEGVASDWGLIMPKLSWQVAAADARERTRQ